LRSTLRRALAAAAAALAIAVPTVAVSAGSAQAATSYYAVSTRGGNCVGYLNFDRRGGGSNWAQGAVYMLSSDHDLACEMVLQRSTDGGNSWSDITFRESAPGRGSAGGPARRYGPCRVGLLLFPCAHPEEAFAMLTVTHPLPAAIPPGTASSRHVVVLACGNPALEEALAAAGHRVSVITPVPGTVSPSVTRSGGRVVAIPSWADYAALARADQALGPGVDAVVTAEEAAIRAAAFVRSRRGLPGLAPAQARAYTDKALMKATLQASGLPVARHLVLRRAERIPAAARALGGSPVVVKPRLGAGSWHVMVVRDPDHLEQLVAEGVFDEPVADVSGGRFTGSDMLHSLHGAPGGFLVEEHLDVAQEFFVDLYRDHAARTLLAVPGRYSAPLLATVGQEVCFDTLLPRGDPTARHAVGLAERAARALGAGAGAVHVELLRTTSGRWLVGEAAARPGGGPIGALTALQYGTDVPRMLADLAVGQVPRWNPVPRHRALSALVLAPPPGIVASLAPGEEIAALPGVVAVNLSLRVGEPVPPHLGSMSLAGNIVFQPASVGPRQLAAQAETMTAALRLRIQPQQPDPTARRVA
jgi:phosphoribosylaminoimidazole carboxylase (NCAIR synthetase)